MSRYSVLMSRNENGVTRTTAASTSSRTAYIRTGTRTRSAIRPPTKLPTAIPPKNPARIADTACVVFPNTRTSWRDHTISSISAAAPDRTKIARRTARFENVISEPVCPVHAESHHHHSERDQQHPAHPDDPASHSGQPAERHHERDRVKEVSVTVLEPAAAVVKQRRDEDRDRRPEQPPGAWPSPVGLRGEEQTRARDQDRHPETVGFEVRKRVHQLR